MKPTRFSFVWIVALAFGSLLGCSGMQTGTQSARITSIPPGMRAVSIRVNGTAGIVPGTHVDVLVTGNATEPQTTTVLQDVEVAVSEPRSLGVITVLASPKDAEKLALASQRGHIQLVARK